MDQVAHEDHGGDAKEDCQGDEAFAVAEVPEEIDDDQPHAGGQGQADEPAQPEARSPPGGSGLESEHRVVATGRSCFSPGVSPNP